MVTSKLPHREEYLKRRRRRRYVTIGIFVFAVVLTVSLVSYFFHRPEFRIVKVELTGGVLVTQDEVAAKTFDFLSGSYFWLFPKNNAFLYPHDELEEYLKENFKRIDTIDVGLSGFKKIIVKITERKHFAIWCKGLPKGTKSASTTQDTFDDDEVCFFMDRNSTIFAPAPNFSGDAYFKYYGLLTVDNPIGTEFISSSTQFADISGFVDSVKKLSLRPQYVLAKGNNEYEIKLSSGTDVLFDTKESLQKTLENLSLLLSTDALSSLDKNTFPVDYVDLRFGNKLFYKLKTTSTTTPKL